MNVPSLLKSHATRTLAIAAVVLVVLSACSGLGGEATLAGYERSPEPSVADITLPAANRDTDAFAFQAPAGELLLVNFGYTTCPDICPTTLADTRQAFTSLGERADQVNMAFVSIDPELDDETTLTNYVEAFLENGIALRTDNDDDLKDAANAFGVSYQIGFTDEGDREVGHTANVFVVDEAGSVVLTWPFGVPATDMTNDLNILLDRMP